MRENVSILFLLSDILHLKDMNTHNNIQYSNNKKMWMHRRFNACVSASIHNINPLVYIRIFVRM